MLIRAAGGPVAGGRAFGVASHDDNAGDVHAAVSIAKPPTALRHTGQSMQSCAAPPVPSVGASLREGSLSLVTQIGNGPNVPASVIGGMTGAGAIRTNNARNTSVRMNMPGCLAIALRLNLCVSTKPETPPYSQIGAVRN